jgi:hypothetical protein
MIRSHNKKFILKESATGKHIFGGSASHEGSVPYPNSAPTHLLFRLDVSEGDSPFSAPNLKYLPLYYPLKYGFGGPEMQYKVISDTEIKIIHLSADQDDGEDASVKVDQFPEVRFTSDRSVADDEVLSFTDFTIGGELEEHEKFGCLNPECKSFGKHDDCELIASIPPIPIDGEDEIWWEFEGAYVFFQFCYCRTCDSILTYNTCT